MVIKLDRDYFTEQDILSKIFNGEIVLVKIDEYKRLQECKQNIYNISHILQRKTINNYCTQALNNN